MYWRAPAWPAPVQRRKPPFQSGGESTAFATVQLALLRLLERVLRLAPRRLELLGALEIRDGLAAAAAPEQRVAEVVVREALVGIRRPSALEALDGLLEERHGARVVAAAHQRIPLVVEPVRIAAGRDGGCSRRRRRRRSRGGRYDRRPLPGDRADERLR